MSTLVTGVPHAVDCVIAFEMPAGFDATGVKVKMQLRPNIQAAPLIEITETTANSKFSFVNTQLQLFFAAEDTTQWPVQTPKFKLYGTIIGHDGAGQDKFWLPVEFEFISSFTR